MLERYILVLFMQFKLFTYPFASVFFKSPNSISEEISNAVAEKWKCKTQVVLVHESIRVWELPIDIF